MSYNPEPIGFMSEPISNFMNEKIELPEDDNCYSENRYSNKKFYSKEHFKILTDPVILKQHVIRYRIFSVIALLFIPVSSIVGTIMNPDFFEIALSLTLSWLPFMLINLPKLILTIKSQKSILPSLKVFPRVVREHDACYSGYTIDKNLNSKKIYITQILNIKYEKDEILIKVLDVAADKNILVSPLLIFPNLNECEHYIKEQTSHRRLAYNGILDQMVPSKNFEILVNNDPTAKAVEYTYKFEKYLTTENSIKDFLNYAEDIIPKITEQSEDLKNEQKYYKEMSKNLAAGIKKLKV